MEEILGAHNTDRDFERYLDSWQSVMASRIEQAAERIGDIRGLRGLILAGSNGIGQPWPLSDIDLIPVYDDGELDQAVEKIERVRLALLADWSTQGWRTGLDVGRLHFGTGEVETNLALPESAMTSTLADDRWYHTIDKAYGGRALFDEDGQATSLAAWFTNHRFAPEVVAVRLSRSAAEARASLDAARLANDDLAGAFGALLKSIQWLQINLMEQWGERDNSLGRFGTRFARRAAASGKSDLADTLDALGGLDESAVQARLVDAPAWVHERNDRSWKARNAVKEDVTRMQSDRDVLRVCTIYGLRVAGDPPFADWLGIPAANDLRDRAETLARMFDRMNQSAQ